MYFCIPDFEKVLISESNVCSFPLFDYILQRVFPNLYKTKQKENPDSGDWVMFLKWGEKTRVKEQSDQGLPCLLVQHFL